MPDTETPQPVFNGRTLVYDGLAQTDIDMDNHRLLNLDDSNLNFGSAPPTIGPVAHKWLRSWNSTTRVWGITQPVFTDISGALTTGIDGQQRAITELGTITIGVWKGTVVEAAKVPTLNNIRGPIGDVTMVNHKITNLADPASPQDAVNLRYVNATLPGLKIKESVFCATTVNIVRSGLQKIDGIDVQVNQRVLVKNQTDPSRNGIFKVVAGASWTRAPDCDTADELEQAYCFVRYGTANANTAWVQINDIPTLETSPVHYVFFSMGTSGPPGDPGPGVPVGGTTDQILAKINGTNYNTHWITGTTSLFAAKNHGLPDDALLGGGTVELPDVIGTPIDGMVLAYWGARPNHSIWIDGSIIFADIHHGTPDDALITGTIDEPDLTGTPTDGMSLHYWAGAPNGKHSIWVDGSIFFARTDHGLPDDAILTGDVELPEVIGPPVDGMVLARWGARPNHSIWIDGSILFAPLGKGLPPDGTNGQVLVKDDTVPAPYISRWLTPSPSGAAYAVLQTTQMNPAGTVLTDNRMMGLNQTFTPFVTGKVIVTIAGFILNSSTGSAGTGIRYGTGTPPANGVLFTGTGIGAAAICGPNDTGNVRMPFSLTAALTGLTVGTAIWIDLSVIAGPPGTATVSAVTISAWEIP